MMCYRLASELSDRIAAIAPVAGTMAIETCRPRRPVPVLHFHGTKDGLVLFDGPGRADPEEPEVPVGRGLDPGLGQGERLPGDAGRRRDAGPRRRTAPTVRVKTYGPGKDGSEVILYVIEGGGHTWPGREPPHPVPRQEHEGHLGQRPDLGLLPEAPDEVNGAKGRGPPSRRGHRPAAQRIAATTCCRPNGVSSERRSWPSSV